MVVQHLKDETKNVRNDYVLIESTELLTMTHVPFNLKVGFRAPKY